MILLYLYVSLATLVAYAGTAALYKPLLEDAQELGVFNRFTMIPRTGLVVCFLTMWVLAPIMLWCLCRPYGWYRLGEAMRKDMLTPE